MRSELYMRQRITRTIKLMTFGTAFCSTVEHADLDKQLCLT
jgi:hypothetical protein